MRPFLFLLVLVMLQTQPLVSDSSAQEISFWEQFALSEDRSKTLETLVPGSESWYFFHCLHAQNENRLDEVDSLLKRWIKRHSRTGEVSVIENRQALLRYGEDPKRTLEYLIRHLGVDFNHQRKIPQAQKGLPNKLAASKIDPEKLIGSYLKQDVNSLGNFDQQGLYYLANRPLNTRQRRALLERLKDPTFPDVVGMIAKDLKGKDATRFGGLEIHRRLTRKQLEELAALVPELNSQQKYINELLLRMRPSADVNLRSDRVAYRKYLDDMWAAISDLSPSFNGLKVSVLYRLLELDQRENRMDRKRFVSYLELPRNVAYINPRMTDGVLNTTIARLDENFSDVTSCLPVISDEALVLDYLHHFLESAPNANAFSTWFESDYLKRQFATAKILSGNGDRETWASMLSAAEYQQLLDRIDLDFAVTNQEFFSLDEAVELRVMTKNIDKLIVKVFEINTRNFYRQQQKEIDTDIDLDGLVANDEQLHEYDDPPFLRKQRSFKFEKLSKRGVYIIDFIGGGKSSRALIRKGKLQLVGNVTPIGQRFNVFNESGDLVTDATLSIAGRKYRPDEDGSIDVPFSAQGGSQNAIVSHGDFCTWQRFQPAAEQYQFNSAFHIDRESLSPNNVASIAIRPSLSVAGQPIPLSRLDSCKLEITTTSHDGISATRTITDLKLSSKQEATASFVVPPRLQKISLRLESKLTTLLKKEVTLSASDSLLVNQIDSTSEIRDVHLMPTNQGWFAEVLGKTGEARKGQPVRFKFRVAGFKQEIDVDLQSDENGLIELGSLENVLWLEATVAGGTARRWNPNAQSMHLASNYHVLQGEPLAIPLPASGMKLDRSLVSLLEIRSGRNVRDCFADLKVDGQRLVISNLLPGDYQLRLRSRFLESVGSPINIRVTQGKAARGVLVGSHRILQQRRPKQPFASGAAIEGDRLSIRIEDATDSTRVHLYPVRYLEAFDAFTDLGIRRRPEPWQLDPAIRRSAYLDGRKIGEEYQYILNRRYAPRFPGNMLERPSLLANPWAVQDTTNVNQTAQSGDAASESGVDGSRAAKRAAAKSKRSSERNSFANLDFLDGGQDSVLNVAPDKDGFVKLTAEQIGDAQAIRIVVVDRFSVSQTRVLRKPQPLTAQDQRLANALDPSKHYRQARQIDVLEKGDSLLIRDVVSAQFQQYDELSDVYNLYRGLGNDAGKLRQFRFILSWLEKTDAEKEQLYSKYACHELSFFIHQKDQPFFERVVKKHLLNKREKTFLDHWLLGHDVSPFLEPWRFARLNVVEKILLAQVFEERRDDIVKHIDELYDLAPTPRSRFEELYRFSLMTRSLDERKLGRAMLLSGGQEFDRRSATVAGKYKNAESLKDLNKDGDFNDSGRFGESFALSEPTVMAVIPGDSSGQAGEISMGSISLGLEAEKSNLSKARKSGGRGRGESRVKIVDGIEQKFEAPFIDADEEDFEGVINKRLMAQQLYRRIEPTREWIENHYYHLLPAAQDASLVAVNQFWRDYANHDGGSFASQWFSEANSNFTEMMFALSVLDLPLSEVKENIELADKSVTIRADGPMIVLHQQNDSAELDDGSTRIFVSENFYQSNDRYRFEDGVQFDKFVEGDFLANVLYGAEVVITNPTSTPMAIEVLVQIPRGAMPIAGSWPTRNFSMQLDAFSTQKIEYSFYFPSAGEFTHFPAHVSDDEKILAAAEIIDFRVTDQRPKEDKASWQWVSQNGTQDDVINYLVRENIQRIDPAEIAFRMKDREFFKQATDVLRQRCRYDHVLWSYSLKHNDADTIREYVKHADNLTSSCGIRFDSELLTIDPVERNWFQQREFSPLVNSRAHQLGATRKILNSRVHQQYEKLMRILGHTAAIDSDDRLAVTYYLLLQDRIDEALKHFQQIEDDSVKRTMPYAYCDAYLDLYREEPDRALAKAKAWTDYPVDRWRNRFANIVAMVNEINGEASSVADDKDQTQRQDQLASLAPGFEFSIAASEQQSGRGKGTVNWRNIDELTINYYQMDIEFLFSSNPFARDQIDGFSLIRPNHTQTVRLAADNKEGQHEFTIPEQFDNQNVLVEVVAGESTQSKTWYSNSMEVQVIEAYGQILLTDRDTDKPLGKAYVKVFARDGSGNVAFHKDGYTDLRGRFDYVTQSNRSLDGIADYAILIISDEKGAVIREAKPPRE